MHGTATKTSGGLTKKQLKYNKQGKIVSRKASALAKKNNRLVKAGYVTKKGRFGVSMRGGGEPSNNGEPLLSKTPDNIKRIRFPTMSDEIAHYWCSRIQVHMYDRHTSGPALPNFNNPYNKRGTIHFKKNVTNTHLAISTDLHSHINRLLYTGTLEQHISINRQSVYNSKRPKRIDKTNKNFTDQYRTMIMSDNNTALKAKLTENPVKTGFSVYANTNPLDGFLKNNDPVQNKNPIRDLNTAVFFIPKSYEKLKSENNLPKFLQPSRRGLSISGLLQDGSRYITAEKIDILYVPHNQQEGPANIHVSDVIRSAYDMEQSVFFRYDPNWFEKIIRVTYTDNKRNNIEQIEVLKQVNESSYHWDKPIKHISKGSYPNYYPNGSYNSQNDSADESSEIGGVNYNGYNQYTNKYGHNYHGDNRAVLRQQYRTRSVNNSTRSGQNEKWRDGPRSIPGPTKMRKKKRSDSRSW
jgi:hypothetical protein